ncbi:N-acetylmuramoyl-L-alanine amidase [Deinococcus deserti]|uniref:Putative N-acetylmuramoyl-L-alanine amidase, Cell wall hydrolase/Autolysin n=2 Tax=Deinococcus TaxID=1298 RepID=C1D1R1_DEIDV|nr:putative N-acetylmuramoyl-L-alanine amidase precursor, Cell wall hydrolase/Autolysin [Deinococcus deserti VCD115]
MRHHHHLALLSLLGALGTLPASPARAQSASDIFVSYPESGHRVAHSHVILQGSVTPGATLTVSGQAVPVGPDGLFMAWWPLRPGTNDLRLVSRSGSKTATRTLRVVRTVPRVLPASPTAIDRETLTPREAVEFWDLAGDSPAERTVKVGFVGSPGGRATFRINGGAAVPMREGTAGAYSGTFVLPVQALLKDAPVTVSLTGRDGRTVTATAAGRISGATGETRLGVQNPGSVHGLALNEATTLLTDLAGAPLLYPRDDMAFTLVGRQGRDYRVRLAPGVPALVTQTQVQVSPGPLAVGAGGAIQLEALRSPVGEGASVPALFSPPPLQISPAVPVPAVMTAPVMTRAPRPDLTLRLPLGGARLPFTVTQDSPQRLVLTLYGPLATPLTAPQETDPLLGSVEVRPLALEVTRVVVNLTTPQLWGFHAGYDGNDLQLTVRRPPALNPARPLEGRTITLDPGHGGTQGGGAGSLRTPEKGLVLPITLRAAELLRAQGATVHLTRTADVTVSLYDRGLTAEATGSDLLVSVHANALPDGRDPRGVRGPEVYFTHPQAQPLAASLLAALRAGLPEIGPGAGLKPGANLALTRPSAQISVLVELAYLTDAGNLRALHNPEARERFAQAIAGGVTAFYTGQARR